MKLNSMRPSEAYGFYLLGIDPEPADTIQQQGLPLTIITQKEVFSTKAIRVAKSPYTIIVFLVIANILSLGILYFVLQSLSHLNVSL